MSLRQLDSNLRPPKHQVLGAKRRDIYSNEAWRITIIMQVEDSMQVFGLGGYNTLWDMHDSDSDSEPSLQAQTYFSPPEREATTRNTPVSAGWWKPVIIQKNSYVYN